MAVVDRCCCCVLLVFLVPFTKVVISPKCQLDETSGYSVQSFSCCVLRSFRFNVTLGTILGLQTLNQSVFRTE